MLVTPILFAASLTLGQVLLAEQRFFWYGLAPLLYNAGIVLGTLALQRRLRHLRAGHRRGHRGGPPPRQPIRRPAGSRFRIRLGWSVRTLVGAGVRPAHAAEDGQPPGRAGRPSSSSRPWPRALAAGSVTSFSFARNFQSVPVSLIGVAFALAAFPGPVDAPTPPATGAASCGCCARTWSASRGLTVFAAHRAGRARRARHPASCWAVGRSTPTTWRAPRLGPRCLRPLGPVREPHPPAQPGDLRHPAHAASRPSPRSRARDHRGRHAAAAAELGILAHPDSGSRSARRRRSRCWRWPWRCGCGVAPGRALQP